jgi:hypothetical protein
MIFFTTIATIVHNSGFYCVLSVLAYRQAGNVINFLMILIRTVVKIKWISEEEKQV